MIKPCVKCGATDRYKSGDCRPCAAAYRKARRADKKAPWGEKQKASRDRWREKNKEHLVELRRQYNFKNKEIQKEKRKINHERIKENADRWNSANIDYKRAQAREYNRLNRARLAITGKQWREENKDHVKEVRDAYREKNREVLRGKSKVYREAHREEYIEHSRRRRAIVKGLPVEKFKAVEIYDRDGWMCGICHKKVNKRLTHPHPLSPSLDHIVPIKNNGPHLRSNVQLAHLLCNVKAKTEGIKQLLMFG